MRRARRVPCIFWAPGGSTPRTPSGLLESFGSCTCVIRTLRRMYSFQEVKRSYHFSVSSHLSQRSGVPGTVSDFVIQLIGPIASEDGVSASARAYDKDQPSKLGTTGSGWLRLCALGTPESALRGWQGLKTGRTTSSNLIARVLERLLRRAGGVARRWKSSAIPKWEQAWSCDGPPLS